MAARARLNPRYHDARRDRGERLKRTVLEVPFELLGDVIVTRDISELGLCVGDVGTVVERHLVPDHCEEGYSVGFFDMITRPNSLIGLATG